MRKGRRVWDQVERRFVTDWLSHRYAKLARDTFELLTPGASELQYWNDRSGQMTKRFVVRKTRSGRRK